MAAPSTLPPLAVTNRGDRFCVRPPWLGQQVIVDRWHTVLAELAARPFHSIVEGR
jgi:hypothetical protein